MVIWFVVPCCLPTDSHGWFWRVFLGYDSGVGGDDDLGTLMMVMMITTVISYATLNECTNPIKI